MPPPRCRPVLIAMFLALLPACGQKGPLYLPDTNGAVVTRPTQTPSESVPVDTSTQQDPDATKKPTEPSPAPR